MHVAYPLTVYVDATCPLCMAEFASLKRHDRAARIALVDCSPHGFSDPFCTAAGIEAPALMRRIHARAADGRWLTGVPVFAAAYRAVGVDMVADVFASRRLAGLLNRAYPWIADHRTLLSRLGLVGLFGWCVDRLARRAQRRTAACGAQCQAPVNKRGG